MGRTAGTSVLETTAGPTDTLAGYPDGLAWVSVIPDMPFDDEPTVDCPACHSTVPGATFCGDCGANLTAPVSKWRTLLRPRVFSNAHRETVWLPRVTSTLFPRIAGPTRKPYRLGLIAILIAICVLSVMQLNGPLGVISVVGWPLMFLIYVWESDVFTDIPARILITSMLLGIGLGTGAWLTAGKLIASSYGLSTGSSLLLLGKELHVGFLISIGGGFLMVVPALATRLFPMPVRESLDGFVVGAFGALWHSVAATSTILAPQFAEGLMEQQSTGLLFEDSITYGIVSAVVTTTLGGVVGLALWFQPDRRDGRDPRRARRALTVCAALAAGCYVAVWWIDSWNAARTVELVLEVGFAVLALIVVRCAVQIALLHESPDPATGDPILCVHCERVVPDLPFCVACGAAGRASSQSSRRRRRTSPPVLLGHLTAS